MMRRALLASVALAVATFTHAAWSFAPVHVNAGRINSGAHALRIGRSLGSPTDGRLIGGAHLDDAPYLRVVPVYVARDVRWGLEPLVTLLDRSARAVRRQYPEAVMSVGHLSRAGGGDIDRHASHESGRDADVGFYVRSQTGRPLYADHFVAFRADGTAPTWPGASFDDARNWALVAALSSDPSARVTYIFVASPLRTRLLAYAEKTGAPLSVRVRAAELMVQPRGSLPHDDHFHVRIGCPSGMTGCIEFPTSPRARRLAHGLAARARNRGLVTTTHGTASPVRSPDPSGGRSAGPLPSLHKPSPTGPDVHDTPPETDDAVGSAHDARDEEAAPPASIEEPIDDVDGPISSREPGAAALR